MIESEVTFKKDTIGNNTQIYFNKDELIQVKTYVSGVNLCTNKISAIGDNYTPTTMNGELSSGFLFYKPFMENDISRWKIWIDEKPELYQYVTLIKDSSVSTGTLDEVDNNRYVYTIEVIDEKELIINCCTTSGTIKFNAIKETIGKNESGFTTSSTTNIGSIITVSSQNRNNLHIANSTNTGVTYTINDNCDNNHDIDNLIRFTYNDDTSIYSEYILTQKSGVGDTTLIATPMSLILNNVKNASDSTNVLNYSERVCGSSSSTTYPEPTSAYTKEYVEIKDNWVEISNFNYNTNSNAYIAEFKTTEENKNEKPKYTYASIDSYFDNKRITVYLTQRGNGDTNSSHKICIGFDGNNEIDSDIKLGGVVTYFVGSVGYSITEKIGYDLDDSGTGTTPIKNYIEVGCIDYDTYNIQIENLWVLKKSSSNDVYTKYVIGGSNPFDSVHKDNLSFTVFTTYSTENTIGQNTLDGNKIFKDVDNTLVKYDDEELVVKIKDDIKPSDFVGNFSLNEIATKKGFNGFFNPKPTTNKDNVTIVASSIYFLISSQDKVKYEKLS